MERVFTALGLDYAQWRALAAAYLRIDLRRTGGPRRHADRAPREGIRAYRGLLIVTLLQSGVATALAIALRDAFTATALLTTLSAVNTALLLMADFAGFVVSPDDYWIVGSRPVGPRTYFAARLGAVLAHVLLIAAVLSALPAVALGWRHGITGAGVAFVAAILSAMSAAVVTIAGYAALMARVRPERLSRVVSYLQLALSMLFFGGYYLVIRAFEEARFRELSIGDIAWAWTVPSAWFAALVPAMTGSGGSREWIAVAGAIALTAACVPLAAGRLSLDYAQHLSQASTARDPASRIRRARHVFGFRRGEAQAVSTLIRAQFRNDMRFRMAILTILPLTVFYILLGGGNLSDPFGPRSDAGSVPLFFAVVFMPMTLHGALKFSDSWRAAWVFFATPADPAKLVLAAKNFVATFFLGTYVLLLTIVAAFYYQRVWHAVVHMAIVGAIAHLLLQCAVMMAPAVPFATEPGKAEHSSRLFGLMFFGSIAGSAIPMVLPLVYASRLAMVTLMVVLAAATAGLELVVRARIRAAVLAMEL